MIIKFMKSLFVILFISMFFNSCAGMKYKLKPVNLESNVVIMYSADWCVVCDWAKTFLDEHHIEYIELDYDNEQEFKRLLFIAQELDYSGMFDRVPVFIVRKQILIGYDPDTILWI